MERAWEYSSADGRETEGKLKRERIIKVATEQSNWGGGMGGDPVHRQRADPCSGVRETSPFPDGKAGGKEVKDINSAGLDCL